MTEMLEMDLQKSFGINVSIAEIAISEMKSSSK